MSLLYLGLFPNKMPYTPKQKKLMRGLIKQYGMKKAESVYHGMKASKKHKKLFP